MKSYLKTDRHKKLNIKSICIGLAASIVVTFFGILVSSYIASKTIVGKNFEIIITWGTWMLSSFAGCIIGKVTSKEYHILEAMLIGIGYLFMLTAIQILFYDAKFHRMLEGIMAIILGILVFILTSAYKPKKQNRKFRLKL